MNSHDAAGVTQRLVAAGCVAADEEAAELLAAAPDQATLEEWIRRRERGEPLAHVTGRLRFCGHDVRLGPRVFVPRLQSEELARRAAAALRPGARAADLCTGVGAIAVHLSRTEPEAAVVGVDSDPRAVDWARANGVHCVLGDLDAPLRAGAFDVVTAVAPYVPTGELASLPRDVLEHEPVSALDGGADGLDVVRRVVAGSARLLRPGGWLFTEIGADQHRALAHDLARHGFEPAEVWTDDDGDVRGLAARHAGGRMTATR